MNLLLFLEAVFDGIFDNGLEHQLGDHTGETVLPDIDLVLQSVAVAAFLNVQVIADVGHVLVQMHVLPGGVDAVAQNLGQLDDQAVGPGRVKDHQVADDFQGVVEEMGIDLGGELADLGLVFQAQQLGVAAV